MAPLLAVRHESVLAARALARRGGRWAGAKRPGRSVPRVARIVTAFTLGHSLTLLLGALEIVQVTEPPIEVLIAVSTLVPAAHALRPAFPGREFVAAGAFGLVHGSAFATAISELGLDRWGVGLGTFGFNLGIEAMRLAVVLAAMPWLLLGTTRACPAVRVLGAGFAAVAAAGWTAERALGRANPVDAVVEPLPPMRPGWRPFSPPWRSLKAVQAAYRWRGGAPRAGGHRSPRSRPVTGAAASEPATVS